jgi:hypothetical protein
MGSVQQEMAGPEPNLDIGPAMIAGDLASDFGKFLARTSTFRDAKTVRVNRYETPESIIY